MSLIQKLEAAATERSLGKSTVQCYSFWVRKLYAYAKLPGSQWTGELVRTWMLHLADQNYSAVSRKQALNAIVFVFKNVLKRDLGQLDLPPMPKVRHTLRVIPSREELGRIFAGLHGQVKLMAGLMYGSGLRVLCECCRLRVQDIDLEALTVRVHDGKGAKCRLTVLPALLVPALRRQIAWRAALHEQDLAEGAGLVELPGRLAQKYPGANRELRWQFLFPSTVRRGQFRWHTTDEAIGKQLRAAVKAAGIMKRVTPHTLRHAFATHAMQAGNHIKTVQELLGHEDLNTTAIYLHADAARGFSPLDAIAQPVAAPVQIGGF